MRVRRRYQDGGRTADLLAALERRRSMNQLNSDVQDRMPQPSPAPASSTRVAMQPPVYTSPEAAMLDKSTADYVGFSKMFGEPFREEDAKWMRETEELPTGAIKTSYPLMEFFSPVGDVMAMAEAESGAELAMAAGLAFLPGNLGMIKDALPQFIRPGQINNLSKILDAVDDVSGSADELISTNLPEIGRMSSDSRKELASALQEMSDEISGFPMFSSEEINRLEETARYLKSDDLGKKVASKSAAKSQIGDFKLTYAREKGKDGLVYRMDGSDDYISLVENKPNEFTLVAMLEETQSPSVKGRLLAETIKQVPKGGVVKFGSLNDLSTDSYVFPLSYIEKGKAKADLSNIEFLKLNELGQSPKAFAKVFDIEPRQVGLIDGTAKASADEVAQVKGRIDAKLQSLGLPESKVSGDQILMPHFDMIKTIGKGEFKYGGNLRVVKQAPKGFRTKR
jgi:hypothetical protein